MVRRFLSFFSEKKWPRSLKIKINSEGWLQVAKASKEKGRKGCVWEHSNTTSKMDGLLEAHAN